MPSLDRQLEGSCAGVQIAKTQLPAGGCVSAALLGARPRVHATAV